MVKRKISNFIIILTGICLLFSCSDMIYRENLTGNWEQIGYGRIIKIDSTKYSYYNFTENSCNILVEGELSERFKLVRHNDDTLVLNPGGIVNYYFTKSKKLPQNCLQMDSSNNRNILLNFNDFWKTFDENYAFFDQRNIDWKEIYREYKPQVDTIKTSKELYSIFKEISGNFSDGHIKLDVPDTIKASSKQSKPMVQVPTKNDIQRDIMENYIDDPKQYNNGVIKWGTLKNSRTGYIQISDMNNFANYVKEKSITEKAFYEKYKQQKSRIGALEYFEDEISGVNYIMKQILSDLKDTNPVIIDLRFNGGGYERIALEILSYFVDKTKHAISVSAKTKDGNSPEQKNILEPKGDIYEGQVYLLTSDATASAAEIFALASMQYPDKIFRIGSSTNGIFSEILWKQLPIGWEYSLSNEIYSDPEGKIYEIDGVPCNIDMNYPIKREDFYNSFYKANIFTDETLEMFIKRKTP